MSIVITESEVNKIKKIIKKNTIVNIDRYVTSFLQRRILGRMFSTKKKICSEYISFLEKDPIEALEFNASLSINVTEFFRDQKVWEIFQQKVIPDVIKQSNESIVRVWSAGCATGNEPYSLAISLYNALESLTKNFIIIANDINETLVGIARTGKYDWDALANISFQDLEKHLEKIGERLFKFNFDLKKSINFHVGDIASFNINQVDIIMCRNVLIYYTDDSKDLLFKKFHSTLKDNGFLILGMFENIPSSMKAHFKSISAPQRIYQKIHPPS